MPILSQIRLNQLTGSVIDVKPSSIVQGAIADEYVGDQDLQGVLDYFAQAISNIHGNVEFGSQVLGKISHDGRDVLVETTTSGKVHLNSAGVLELDAVNAVDVDGGSVTIDALDAGSINIGTSADAASDVSPINIGTSATARTITVGSDSSTKVDVNALAIELDSAGTIVLDSVSTTDIDAAGALSLNSSNAAINIGDDADAQPINIGTGASARTITVGSDSSTKVDANALAIELDAVNTVLVDGGKNGADAIKLNASDAAGGFQLFGGTGGFDLDLTAAGDGSGDGAVTVDAGAGISLDAAAASNFTTSAGSLDVAATGASANVLIRSVQSGVQLSGSYTAGIGLSGSVAFSTDGSMTSAAGPQVGNMLFANWDEFSVFRGKSLFSANTTVIGALNVLAEAAGGGVTGKCVFTGSSAGALQLKGAGMSSDTGFTQAISTSEATISNFDVYVNGQLLLQGTNAAGAGGDYGVVKADIASTDAALNFNFDLEADDVILVKTTAEQV